MKKPFFILSALLVATPVPAQAECCGDQQLKYTRHDSGFVIKVKDGPTINFDSRTQKVVFRGLHGSIKTIDLSTNEQVDENR